MTHNKKGQNSGQSVAVLIAIITALIVIYIMFLPAEERERILNDNESSSVSSTNNATSGKTILISEKPGKLEFLSKKEYKHELPAVTLNTETEAKKLKEISSIYVKNNLFGEELKDITLDIEDLENTDSVLLGFLVKEHKGRLIIELNSEGIFDGEIKTANADPIRLQKDMLKASNTIRFRVPKAGAAFWRTNKYSLENIVVTADITNLKNQRSTLTFLMNAAEKNNVEKSQLIFVPDCKIKEVGALKVYINNYEIYSSIPDCGTKTPLEFTPKYLNEGENKIVFSTDKGRFFIDALSVKTDLKEIDYPTYYFDLSNTEYNKIKANRAKLGLYLTFIDDKELKKATISVNGYTTGMNVRDSNFTKNIGTYATEGSNAVKITPENTLEISKLQIVLE